MSKAARAIILKDDKLLLMRRLKHGSEYYTLVGGRLNGDESPQEAVIREVKEETGLDIIAGRLVFAEKHPEPYNSQYIFLCEVAPHSTVEIQPTSEEALMNHVGINMHIPEWVSVKNFGKLHFNTMQLQKAILDGLANGFPDEPVVL